ncbi:olfactory receptor 5F1-like [Stigmatopora nigra]
MGPKAHPLESVESFLRSCLPPVAVVGSGADGRSLASCLARPPDTMENTSSSTTSSITTLSLSGLNFPLSHRVVIFLLVLLCYVTILSNNLTLILLVVGDRKLHKPMYVFLCNLCANAVWGSAGFYPKLLSDLLSPHVISPAGCMLQGYVIHGSSACDFSILGLMAFDRYVALCRPLAYQAFMSRRTVSLLVLASWSLPLLCMFSNSMSLVGKKLCGSHVERLYCVNLVLSKLTCTPARAHGIIAAVNISFFLGIFFLILYSYARLIKMCTASPQMWKRFRQTCTPHVACLLVYAASELADLVYMRVGGADLNVHLHNFMTVEFLVFPPMLNPLIYGLQLTHIRKKIVGFFQGRKKTGGF